MIIIAGKGRRFFAPDPGGYLESHEACGRFVSIGQGKQVGLALVVHTPLDVDWNSSTRPRCGWNSGTSDDGALFNPWNIIGRGKLGGESSLCVSLAIFSNVCDSVTMEVDSSTA